MSNSAREELARACRVLAHNGMIDLWGHVSVRTPNGERILATPRFSRRCLPRTIRAEDILVCDSSGRVEGTGKLPARLEVDLAVYRANPQQRACIFAAPRIAMAAAISGAELKPLTHMESATLFRLQAAPSADAERIARSSALHEPGIGTWAAGRDVWDCLASLYHLEYLAQVNLVVASESGVRGIAPEDSDKIWRQFRGHHHYREFFDALDPGPLAHPYEAYLRRAGDPLKAAMAWSCRALWERGTLVSFLEHISHRAPDGRHFYMTASKCFRDIGVEDVCVLDYKANHVGGPKPPGFKWFHAQLLRERQDVRAVVHTHDVYGRAYALSSRELVPCYRLGLDIATRRMPAYGRCDLIVDEEARRATLDALGDGPLVHEIGHGTDFVADTLEKAAVDAIQREAFLEMDATARRFGTPQPLATRALELIKKFEPGADDWWWYYAAEVGAPRRTPGGVS